MKKIGLTGVIGSGKTTAARYLKKLGVPVFIADDCAKNLMINDLHLKTQIIELLGDMDYIGKDLNNIIITNVIRMKAAIKLVVKSLTR